MTFLPARSRVGGTIRFGRAAALALALAAAGLAVACDGGPSTPQEYIKRAEEYRAKGNLQASLIDLKNALQADPKNAKARRLMGEIYVEFGAWVAGEESLKRAMADGEEPQLVARPLARAQIALGKFVDALDTARVTGDMAESVKAEIQVLRGQAFAGQRKIEEAERAFNEALAHDEKSFGAYLGLAGLAVARRDSKRAEELFAKAQAIAPDAPDVLHYEGEYAFFTGNAAASETAFAKLSSGRPERFDYRMGLARAQIAQQRPADAIKALEPVMKSLPSHPTGNYLRALAAYQSEDYRTALTRTETVRRYNPDHLATILVAGASHYALGQYRQAESDLQRVVATLPSFEPSRRLLAATQLRLNQPTQAVTTLKPLAEQPNADGALLALIGSAAARAGNPGDAVTFFERAVALDPANPRARAQLGATRIALGKTDEGMHDLETAIEDDPSLTNAAIALIVGLLRERRFDAALNAAEELQRKQPKLARAYTLAAMAYLGLNDAAKAVAQLKKAVDVEPGNFEALRNLAALALRNGEFDQARRYLESTLQHHDGHLRALIMLANLEIRLGKRREALRWLEQAVQKNPDANAPRLILGRLYLLENAPEKSAAVVQPALDRYPTEPSLLEVRGKAQLAMKDFRGAVGTFRTLVDAQPPNRGEAHFLLAEALAGTGQSDAVESELETALKFEPSLAQARLVLARLLVSRGKLADADRHVAELGKTFADDPARLELEGDVRLAQVRVADAITAYERAAALARTEDRVIKLAHARWVNNDREKAIGDLKSWLVAYPDSHSAAFQLGSYYSALGQLENAREEFAELTKRRPNSWVPYNELASVLLLMGKAAEALAPAQRALELSRSNPYVLDTLGAVHLALNEPARAVPLLQNARQRAPENREIAANLAKALAGTGRRDEAAELLREILRDDAPFRTRSDAEALLKQLGG